ncbi:hypothetical protein NE237_004789 [Protea cynaroides]|uniref:AB hydrolase-1 domain-containing protein n=1 Tax=Protea cynaroides TaxID=273540 RepID=A0A9Q0KJM4_9MAGN|nr:hypothetical protein NE237_004789 [Protea cynaroides]
MKKIALALLIVILGWAYQVIQFRSPPPRICGLPGGPPITARRIKLSDGRHLAYKEHGVPRENALYKIIFIHGFDCCRHDVIPFSPGFAEEMGIHIVSFDRAGYGESDPNPKRTVKSTALDAEELADQLEFGPKFYVIGYSMGGQAVWPFLKYIPHRLAGAALIAPVINYWWSGFPANLSREAYKQQCLPDQWAVRVAHYTPWLVYWWNTQKWFPSSSVAAFSPDILSPPDKQLITHFISRQYAAQIRQQGEYESLHRDMIIGFGNWEFDPMDLENPFSNKEGSVHLWHGEVDRFVPVTLQRYIAGKLPWIHYHEVRGSGHLLSYAEGISDVIIRTLLLGEK